MSNVKGNKRVDFLSEKFVFGIIGLVLIISAVLLSEKVGEEPIKMLFALGSASFSSLIAGFIEINYKKTLQAGAGFAIFVIVYFNPPAIVKNKIEIVGYVNYEKQALDNASVYIENFNKVVTNDTGRFQVLISKDDIKNREEIKIIVKHNGLQSDFHISTKGDLQNIKLDMKKDYKDLYDKFNWDFAVKECGGKLPKIEDFKNFKDLDSTKQYWTSDVDKSNEAKAYAFKLNQDPQSRGKEIELSVRCKI